MSAHSALPLRAVTWTRAEVGFGKKQLKHLDGIKDERVGDEVARLGKKIVREELAAAAARGEAVVNT